MLGGKGGVKGVHVASEPEGKKRHTSGQSCLCRAGAGRATTAMVMRALVMYACVRSCARARVHACVRGPPVGRRAGGRACVRVCMRGRHRATSCLPSTPACTPLLLGWRLLGWLAGCLKLEGTHAACALGGRACPAKRQ